MSNVEFSYWWRKEATDQTGAHVVIYEGVSPVGSLIIQASIHGVVVQARHFRDGVERPTTDWWITPRARTVYDRAVQQCDALRETGQPLDFSGEPLFVLQEPSFEKEA